MRHNQIDSFYTLTNSPSAPVDLADARAFLRIDDDLTEDNTLITDMILTAVEWGERYTLRDFSEKEWTGLFNSLESTNSERCAFIELRKSPITDITSVEISKAGVLSATTDFIRKQLDGFDRLLFTESVGIDTTVAYTFKVTFDSGFTTNLPATLKGAILKHVGFLYENRGDAGADVDEDELKQLYIKHRIMPGYA